MSTTPFWKKIHQTISGYSRNATGEIVKDMLKHSQNELVEGFLKYKPYTKQGYDDWAAKTKVEDNMKEFIHNLSQDLNLDAGVAYPVMCNYLMFEYYGKIKEFWQITRIGTTAHLKESIWNFYTAERMFLLKTWRHIFEFIDTDYKFAQQYKDFLQSFKLEEFQDNLIKQFEALISEFSSKNFHEKNPYIENLLCRNIREEIEILLILTLTMNQKQLSVSQLTQILKLFVQNNFSTTPPSFELRRFVKKKDLDELMFTEIGCYFVVLENYWNEKPPDLWKHPTTKVLDKLLLSLHLNPGHTIVKLGWAVLRFNALREHVDGQRIMELSNREPFALLQVILSSEVFKKGAVGGIVLRSAHKLLDELCLLYEDRKVLFAEKGVIDVLAEFLKQPNLAEVCLQSRNGLDAVMEIAIEVFPKDFMSLTKICTSLLGEPTQYKQTIHLLNNIPSFLSDISWTIPRDEVSILTKRQPAFPDSELIVFPPNTAVKSYGIYGRYYLQYRGHYSYFVYLEYILSQLIDGGLAQHKFDEELLQKVIAGYGVVIQGVKNCTDMDLQVVGLQRIIQKMNKILIHLDGHLLHFDLVKLYFALLKAMMKHRWTSFFDVCPEIIWKVFFPKLKSDFLGDNIEKLLFNQYIFEDTILMKLFQEEEFKDDHGLLLTYVDILYNIMKHKVQHKNFQVSGVAYLFNFVFFQHLSWVYKDETQRTEITLGCLNIFHHILQKDFDDLSENEQKIYNLCEHAFLNNAHIIESFLRLFIKEKYHLIFLMERESNWISGPSLDRLKCIRMQLALLLIIMNKGKSIGKCTFNERLQYVVKPVASYFTNSYSPVIAELSCRFLEKLAQDESIPLLALLELDHYQVQSLFLERLRDPLEEESVKVAIVDLINTCASKQNGMTAAFFNLKCFMYWDGSDSSEYKGDSVSDFMVDYLQEIKKTRRYFKNPLQLGILRLLHNLWLTHRGNLIENIANVKDFWPVMFDPFFYDFKEEIEVYPVILRIMNLEINAHQKKVDEKLIETVDKFFKDKKRVKEWIRFVLASTENSSKNNLEILTAWIEFLALTKKVTPDSFDDDVKIALMDSCLDGLITKQCGFNNIELTYAWCQLFFMLSTAWRIFESQQKDVATKLIKFLHSANSYYKYLTPKIKEVILGSVNRTIIDLRNYFNNNPGTLLAFLYPVGTIIDFEYEFLESEVWSVDDDAEKIKRLKPWLFIIFIGSSLMELDNVAEIGVWFDYRDFLQRIMSSVGPILQHKSTVPFAKLAINFLISYAQSPLVSDFFEADLFTFYYRIRSPSLTIGVGEAVTSGIPVSLKEWWVIFISLIKFNRLLLHNLGKRMLTTCFTFISQHDSLLNEIISLTKFTVDMTALTLVCETLKLIYTVLVLMPYWYVQAPHSYQLIMDGIKISMNATVLSILGYKKINFYNIVPGKGLQMIDSAPTDLLVSVLNKLIEIIYWGTSCLKKTKPDVIAQLDNQYEREHISLLVENDFSVPRFELPITSKMTYGTLLCLADYLCKTLNQLSPETPPPPSRSRTVSMTDLSKEIRLKTLNKIFEYCTETFDKCIGFMVYMQRSDDLPNEKLSSFLHYDMAEFSGGSTAISQLDYQIVKKSLEALMTFLAGEIFYTMKSLNEEALFAYKRELSSEIQFFYEFVRKRTSEQYHAMVSTPRSSSKVTLGETDIIKRYLMTKVSDGTVNDVADNNFVLVISQWLIKFCHLSN